VANFTSVEHQISLPAEKIRLSVTFALGGFNFPELKLNFKIPLPQALAPVRYSQKFDRFYP
jgi:hypothetical protein